MKALGRRLIVDGQVFQSIARHRGMGRYSEYLLTAIIEERSYGTIDIILANRSHSPEVEPGELKKLFNNVTFVYLDLLNASDKSVQDAEAYNKEVINRYVGQIATGSEAIDFLILSPFQEPIVSVFPDDVSKHLIFYDLIPYLYHEQYRTEMPMDNYLQHFKLLFQADTLLTISRSAQNDLTTYLGIPIENTVPIDGAAIRSQRELVRPDFSVPEDFILMPTGDDPRKNNFRAVQGFEKFNKSHGNRYRLIITSNINPSDRARLKKVSSNIIFTGIIHEASLDWLYDKASAVLFVPETEGLGLPILEAVEANQRVVCSSIDVFREISDSAFYFCDYTDPESIAGALAKVITDKDKPLPKVEYARILRHYSWSATAERAVTAMTRQLPVQRSDKPRIAVFTPSPEGVSAIGKVIAETHATLSNRFDVDYYYEEGPAGIYMRPNYLQYVARYLPAAGFGVDSYKKYDAVFYHVGNSEYHLESITNSLYLPGYVILHDTNISDAYRVMLERDIISKQRAKLEAEINRASGATMSNHIATVVTNQRSVIAHSEYAKNAVSEVSHQKTLVQKVDLPTSVPATVPERSYKTLTFGLAGIIADIKGTEVIERLVKDERYRKHHFSIFGFNYSNDGVVSRLQSYGNVEIATNVTDLDFVQRMRNLDIFVNYRMKYQGETSLSTLEAMRQGVVVVVRNIGWYAELPDESVVKVESIDEISLKLNKLVKDPKSLARISKNAVEYVKKYHSHEKYVDGMETLIYSATTIDKNIGDTMKMLKNGDVKSKADLMRVRSK